MNKQQPQYSNAVAAIATPVAPVFISTRFYLQQPTAQPPLIRK
jgi:hypothetical protein